MATFEIHEITGPRWEGETMIVSYVPCYAHWDLADGRVVAWTRGAPSRARRVAKRRGLTCVQMSQPRPGDPAICFLVYGAEDRRRIRARRLRMDPSFGDRGWRNDRSQELAEISLHGGISEVATRSHLRYLRDMEYAVARRRFAAEVRSWSDDPSAYGPLERAATQLRGRPQLAQEYRAYASAIAAQLERAKRASIR